MKECGSRRERKKNHENDEKYINNIEDKEGTSNESQLL
jgi:hypothetical protein